MKINDIGGEFALIDRLCRAAPANHPDLVAGVGDDAAVIGGVDAGELLLVTTDMLVAGSHFNGAWASPIQIGIKSVACNVSDIAAMGGRPTFMFVSLALPAETDVAWVDGLYQGMGDACRRYGVILAGGDTTRGPVITINIALLGRVPPASLCLRSHAQPDDLLCVTGPLGASAAALAMLQAGLDPPADLKEKHLAPGCRLDVAPRIAPLARAMIDISDGLAAEVGHICDRSGTGARLMAADIPVFPAVNIAAEKTGTDPLTFALSGGEDFELLFSIAPQNRQALVEAGLPCIVIGRVTPPETGRQLCRADGSTVPLNGGYNHFS